LAKRILFVDDEPSLLSGLQRSLRSMRSAWEMQFAEGAKKALELLAAEPCDIIVSDLRMPDMDGLELLAEVQNRYPAMVRMTLSGSEQEILMSANGLAHQCLLKPCDGEMLKGVLAHGFAIHDLLTRARKALHAGEVPSSHYFDVLPLDVAAMVAAVAGALRHGRAARLTFEAEKLKPVRARGEHFLLVLLNLALNAVQAVEEANVAGGRVQILARPTPDAIEIDVKDSGAGVPEEARTRIFKPFFTTRKIGQGTGLGLAVARAVAGQYGGTIRLETAEDQDTTFQLRWPTGASA
jgi:signal transduction histidine kinase